MSGALLVAGTHSDAGKSVVVAGICRWLAREGVSVAPFKAQNMALNSFVTSEGAEIGRAQAAQAAAARTEPEAAMNPILLKPSTERETQVVVRGKPWAVASARSYAGMKKELLPVVLESLRDLRRRYEVVVCEGAGSPAEINLRENDLANMGLARAADLPVLLVGDIDRGGLFASLYGTLALLSFEDQGRLAGFLVNKFRGDPAVLAPGLTRMTDLTGRPFFGTLPWIRGLGLDGEDSLALDAPRPVKPPLGRDVLRVAVARLGRISNFTDFDALAHEPGVSVRFTESAEEILAADLAVLPGTKTTIEDLELIRSRRLDRAFAERARRGSPTLGICGGYQMLGGRIADGVESGESEAHGLSLLPVETVFGREKVLGRPEGRAPCFGSAAVSGYEIHHGRVRRLGGESLFTGGGFEEGCVVDTTLGTSWHGVLESDGFRRALLTWISEERGFDWRPGDESFAAAREAQLEKLGDLVADHVDREALLRLIVAGRVAGGSCGEEKGGVSEAGEARGEASPRERRLRKRSNRERPLLVVNTGHGKGKSTASFGLMLRGWARGYRIGVYQFVKSGKWKVGEHEAALALGNIDWFKMGDGWTWTSRDLLESADKAREGWEEVKRRLADETYDMLLLDEFTYPMKFGWVDTSEVVEVLKNRPGFQHVIITGRDAPPELVGISDLVSEVNKVKHPFDEGYRGQKGIEW